jgi:hypothetical protein
MKRFAIVFGLLLLLAASGAYSQPLVDQFDLQIGPDGVVTGGGTGFYAGGEWLEYDPWYPYPSGWWNQWFYDHPFDPLRSKIVHITFTLQPLDASQPYGLVFALNWSTPDWSYLGLGETWPPIPEIPWGEFDEDLYIVREAFIGSLGQPVTDLQPGDYVFDYIVVNYNPEWVSIDVQGYNIEIVGVIEHECVEREIGTEESTWGAIKSMY